MFLSSIEINESTHVTEIVSLNHRTADVFRRHGIDFCCGGKLPLKQVCEARGLDTNELINELQQAARVIPACTSLRYEDWGLDFLVDYIVHVHHGYINQALPNLVEFTHLFLAGHRKKFPHLADLEMLTSRLEKELTNHLRQEEEIIFPYIKQISNAYRRKETYASLLVRTLRKPVKDIMTHEHEVLTHLISRIRDITSNYQLPEKACALHRVTFGKLKEFDNDLMQHIHLENDILFPRAIEMEKELLDINA